MRSIKLTAPHHARKFLSLLYEPPAAGDELSDTGAEHIRHQAAEVM